MNRSRRSSEGGFSLLELLIVLTIAAILTTFSVLIFGTSRENLHRQNVAREFKISLERARFDAVKRRPSTVADMSIVRVLSSTSFSITIDRNQNGVIDDAAETSTFDFSQRGDVRIAGDGFIYPITIAFDRRGQIRVRNGSNQPITPIFYFCNGSCTPQTATSINASIIYVSPTGTVAMMHGGDKVPAFDNPQVTAIASNFAVNPLLSVWEPDTSTSPYPTPTPSPFPLPSVSPIPTPSPTSSESPTPSPTPPNCAVGERPSDTGCICVAPMWIRKNGKCQ